MNVHFQKVENRKVRDGLLRRGKGILLLLRVDSLDRDTQGILCFNSVRRQCYTDTRFVWDCRAPGKDICWISGENTGVFADLPCSVDPKGKLGSHVTGPERSNKVRRERSQSLLPLPRHLRLAQYTQNNWVGNFARSKGNLVGEG
jgi:hypothetical protein